MSIFIFAVLQWLEFSFKVAGYAEALFPADNKWQLGVRDCFVKLFTTAAAATAGSCCARPAFSQAGLLGLMTGSFPAKGILMSLLSSPAICYACLHGEGGGYPFSIVALYCPFSLCRSPIDLNGVRQAVQGP